MSAAQRMAARALWFDWARSTAQAVGARLAEQIDLPPCPVADIEEARRLLIQAEQILAGVVR